MKLTEYAKKRDFAKTIEPHAAKSQKRSGDDKKRVYVIQKHAARRLHYDLRLEDGGVLKSWAIPKGPSTDPNDKRLAVAVEDHPLDYATFEGTIPKGQYGAGKVELWDQGYWEPEGNVKKDLKEGKLNFVIHGKRLHGSWTLVKIQHSRDDKENQWLLIKNVSHHPGKHSAHATHKQQTDKKKPH